MPIDFPPSPSLNDEYEYGGKVWRRMSGYWSAVSQSAPEPVSSFRIAIAADWKEISVTPMTNQVEPMVGVVLDYL